MKTIRMFDTESGKLAIICPTDIKVGVYKFVMYENEIRLADLTSNVCPSHFEIAAYEISAFKTVAAGMVGLTPSTGSLAGDYSETLQIGCSKDNFQALLKSLCRKEFIRKEH